MADIKITPAVDTHKKAIKDNYVQAVTDLETIQTTNLNTVAKLETAVQGQAAILEKLLKFIKNNMIEED